MMLGTTGRRTQQIIITFKLLLHFFYLFIYVIVVAISFLGVCRALGNFSLKSAPNTHI